MSKYLILSILFIFAFVLVGAHEGHDHGAKLLGSFNTEDGDSDKWIEWIGSFHLVIVHFPIALIFMTAVAESFYSFKPLPLFDNAARFMLISATIFAVPTAILGLIYSYSAPYDGHVATLLWWHMWSGILATMLVIMVAFIREYYGKTRSYYLLLLALFLLVNLTGYLGGEMSHPSNL